MPDRTLKQRLIESLAATQDRERELDRLIDDAPSPDSTRWTAKDHVAHLAHWRRHAAQVLAATHGDGPAPNADDVDGVNAEVQAANKGLPSAEVREAARASYADLAAAIEECSDKDLMLQRPGRDGAMWEVVGPNCHLHLGEHLGFWHQAHGDERAAEQSQLWTRDVSHAAFIDPKSRAFGTYNLACYYARLGRSAEALPHFKHSFELHPALKEWAHTDKDLDRIRDEPELRAILA